MIQEPAQATSPESDTPVSPSERVCVGAVAGAHGVRGAVKIKPFTAEPRAVASYGPVTDESGTRSFRLRITEVRDDIVVATIHGIAGRDAAKRLKGLRLYVSRAALPPPEQDEFYHADLIGLPVELEDGTAFGRVRGLDDFGAGHVIEVEPHDGGMPLVLPFTREFVPIVDVSAKRVVVSPPESLLAPARPDERGGDG